MTNWCLGQSISKVNRIGVPYISHSAANTKGSWIDVNTGLDYNCYGLIYNAYSRGESADFLTDIGIGSTPDIIVNNLIHGHSAGDLRVGKYYYLPIFVPKSTAIKTRCQSNYSGTNGMTTVWYAVQGQRWNQGLPTSILTYGANTADSGGTAVDPGTTADTFGSYVEFVASLPYNIRGFIVGIGPRGDYTRSANINWFIDVAKGSSGNEETLLDQWEFGTEADVDMLLPQQSVYFPISVEKGARLAVRSKCNTTTSDRLFDVVLYCFA